MLFGEGYDFALWQIIKTDKKNREEIISFIKEFPKELYGKMQDDLIKIEKRKETHIPGKGNYEIFSNIVEKNNKIYQYQIDEFFESLKITKFIRNKNFLKTVFEIELQNINLNQLFDEGEIGYLNHNIDNKENNEKIEYNLVTTPVGSLIYYNIGDKAKIKIKYLAKTDAPKDLETKDLERCIKSKKLLRTKQRIYNFDRKFSPDQDFINNIIK